MQTSFIPKKPVVESRPSGEGISLFLLLAIIVFIVSLSAGAGVFLWQKKILGQIEQAKADLNNAKSTYEEDTIEDLIRLDSRIVEAKQLLSKHLTIAPVFTLLEKNIIRNVQLKSLKFAYSGNDQIKIDLTGVARNYDALSKQSDVFGADNLRDYISQPIISDFTLNQDGSVSFNFNAMVKSGLVSYANKLAGEEQVVTDTNTSDASVNSNTGVPAGVNNQQ